jgi:fumarylacetoacetate (FAA) hydrolase
MKLATYRDGSRDGQLVVVSRDLCTAHYATGMAGTLQQVLDDWNFIAPQLQDLYVTLNHGKARHAFPFEPAMCMAPLPRTHAWGGGTVLGPMERIGLGDEAWGADFEAQWAVITGDVPQGAPAEAALEGVRLLMLANAVCLREWRAQEGSPLAGLDPSRPATAFSPVAVTLDELGEAWRHGRVHLRLQTRWNGRPLGLFDGSDTATDFGSLLAGCCQTRSLPAGSIVCSGPLLAGAQAGPVPSQGAHLADNLGPKGHASLADKRAQDMRQGAIPTTGFLRWGDTLHIDMKGRDGLSLCGAIEQTVAPVG